MPDLADRDPPVGKTRRFCDILKWTPVVRTITMKHRMKVLSIGTLSAVAVTGTTIADSRLSGCGVYIRDATLSIDRDDHVRCRD